VVEEVEEELLFDYLHAIAYQGHSLSLTILGEEENIKSIRRNDLVSYIKTHYTAPRMVVVGSGAVKHEEVVKQAEQLFQNLSTANNAPARKPVEFVGSEIRLPNDSKEVAHVIFAFEGVGWSHPHYFTFMIIQSLIGNWDRNMGGGKYFSSRLAYVVSSAELAHSFQTLSTCYYTTGILAIYAIAPPDKLERLSYEIFEEFRLLGHNLTQEELTRVKNKVKSSFLMHLDGSMAIAEDIGRHILTLNRRLTPAELFARIDSIQISDVIECLDLHFNDICPAIVASGPINNLPTYNTMREWTNWSGKRVV